MAGSGCRSVFGSAGGRPITEAFRALRHGRWLSGRSRIPPVAALLAARAAPDARGGTYLHPERAAGRLRGSWAVAAAAGRSLQLE